jgi:hypothetical protein
MHFEFGFMMLNPESTISTVKEDIIFLKEINKIGEALVHFTKTVPYAGTPIATRLETEGRLRGTLASPDYGYKDPKIELLQLFLTEAFHFRNFDKNGLVERLRYTKFDAIVLHKFFSDVYDTQTYSQSIRDLIRECNAACLENLSLSIRFMEKQTKEEIQRNWFLLDDLVKREISIEHQISSSLNSLMGCYA